MNLINYGGYNFPNPQPFVALGDNPVYVSGLLDNYVESITLIGNLTGSGLQSLALAKMSMETGLASEYKELNIGGQIYPVAKPIGISFDDSNLLTVLPYSVEFLVYTGLDFSRYMGVEDPQNSWTYSEQQGRIVKATHTVSAKGVKTQASASLLDNAKKFVNENIGGFQNLSTFFKGNKSDADLAVLKNRTEEVNRAIGFYSLTDEYDFSITKSDLSVPSGIIVTANSKILFSNDKGLQANVEGSIYGCLSGSGYSRSEAFEEIFGPKDAEKLVSDVVVRSKSDFENKVYSFIQNGPTSYSYNKNKVANTIDFSFSFFDPERSKDKEFDHQYTVDVSATKDSATISATVNGTAKYSFYDSIFENGKVEDSERFGKLKTFFKGLNPFNLALGGYEDFTSEFDSYEDGQSLQPDVKSSKIDYDPFEPSVTYSYQYTTEPSGNFSISISDQPPILVSILQESVGGFALQEGVNNKLGKLSIDASKKGKEEDMPLLIAFAEKFFPTKKCFKTANSTSEGGNSINYSVEYVYKE